MIPGTVPCPRCRMVNIPIDGRLMCHGCTRELARVVPGEEELLYQRWCDRCMTWWPFDGEFWYVKQYQRGDVVTSRGLEYTRQTSGASVFCISCQRTPV